MNYTPEQLAGFKAEFARRQKRQLGVAAVIFAGVIAIWILRDRSPLESPAGITVFLAAMGAILVYTLQNWRCPACGKYLGKGAFPRFCPQCGVALK